MSYQTYSRAIPREELESYVDYLSKKYPKCFFLDPRMRRPLKKGILDDLRKEQVLDDEKRTAAVAFYTRNWTYQSMLQAGVERVDLNGSKAGTVTQLEQLNAQKKIQQEKKQRKEISGGSMDPIAVMSRLHDNRQITTDQLSKVTLVPSRKASVAAYGRLQKLVETLCVTAADTSDEGLKQALVAATLKVLIAEAQQLVELNGARQS